MVQCIACGREAHPWRYERYERCCSGRCHKRLQGHLKPIEPKRCERCGKPISRYEKGDRMDSPAEYAERRFCSKVCVGRASSPQGRHCPVCLGAMPRRIRPNGQPETSAEYRERLTCSRECLNRIPRCQCCRKRIRWDSGIPRVLWLRQQFCDLSCLAKHRWCTGGNIGRPRGTRNKPRATHPMDCQECGMRFNADSASRYCSPRCRQRASERRRREGNQHANETI